MRPDGRIGILISGRGSNMESIVLAAEERRIPAVVAVVISNEPGAPGIARAQARGVEAVVLDHRRAASREDQDRRIVGALEERRVEVPLSIPAGAKVAVRLDASQGQVCVVYNAQTVRVALVDWDTGEVRISTGFTPEEETPAAFAPFTLQCDTVMSKIYLSIYGNNDILILDRSDSPKPNFAATARTKSQAR